MWSVFPVVNNSSCEKNQLWWGMSFKRLSDEIGIFFHLLPGLCIIMMVFITKRKATMLFNHPDRTIVFNSDVSLQEKEIGASRLRLLFELSYGYHLPESFESAYYSAFTADTKIVKIRARHVDNKLIVSFCPVLINGQYKDHTLWEYSPELLPAG